MCWMKSIYIVDERDEKSFPIFKWWDWHEKFAEKLEYGTSSCWWKNNNIQQQPQHRKCKEIASTVSIFVCKWLGERESEYSIYFFLSSI